MEISVASVVFVVMEKSVQQLLDEKMCRPGYRWNDTLKRCLGPAGGGDNSADPEPPPGEKPGAQAEPAKGGRGDVRVNPAGIQQTGTKMGKSVSIK